MNSVLVVESDQISRSATVSALQSAGFHTMQAEGMDDALDTINKIAINAALVDYELPDGSAVELISTLHKNVASQKVMSIVMGPCCNETARIVALQNGADDVLSKPISLNELILRLQNLFSRDESQGLPNFNNKLNSNGIELDIQSLQAIINGARADLSLCEFRLLYNFMRSPNKVLTRSDIKNLTKGSHNAIEERSIDVYIMRLRKNLNKYGKSNLIQTVRGVGYRFSD